MRVRLRRAFAKSVKLWLKFLGNDLLTSSSAALEDKKVTLDLSINPTKIKLSATGEHVVPPRTGRPGPQAAFDFTFTVPPGGFKPPAGKEAWRMEKPEGLVWRRLIYTKHSGETITRRGFFSTALKKHLYSPETGDITLGGEENLRFLGNLIGVGIQTELNDVYVNLGEKTGNVLKITTTNT